MSKPKPWIMENSFNIMTKIEANVDLCNEIKQEIYKKEMIADSLTDTILRLVQSIWLPLTSGILEKAWHQQSEKKKSDRREYEFVKEEMIQRFFNGNKKEVSLDKIVNCGYDTYAYNLYFKYHKIVFQIVYPCPNNIIKDEYLTYTDYGKYILRYEDKDKCWDWITSSYKEEDITKAIEDFITKQKGN